MTRRRSLPIVHTSLPPLQAAWLAELLPGPLPAEPPATCDDCAMLPPPGSGEQGDAFFNPNTKCCTYVPVLHNYLVGRILSDADPGLKTGRKRVALRLRGRVGVTPLGIRPGVFFQRFYEAGSDVF